MKRGLFTTAAILSLLLAITVLVDRCTHPWHHKIYGYSFSRTAGDERVGYALSMQTGNGAVLFGLHITVQDAITSTIEPGSRVSRSHLPPESFWNATETWWNRRGFAVSTSSARFGIKGGDMPPTTSEHEYVMVPSWLLLLLFLVLPAIWFWKYRHRIRPGHCQVCGYDLRASPQRCPECGAEVTPTQLPTSM